MIHWDNLMMICYLFLLLPGHMLFEMCAGYELCTFRPSAVQLSDIQMYPQVCELITIIIRYNWFAKQASSSTQFYIFQFQVLRFLELIFAESEHHFTSIEELLIHDLFRNIDLREMRCAAVTVGYWASLFTLILNSPKSM